MCGEAVADERICAQLFEAAVIFDPQAKPLTSRGGSDGPKTRREGQQKAVLDRTGRSPGSQEGAEAGTPEVCLDWSRLIRDGTYLLRVIVHTSKTPDGGHHLMLT